MELCGRVYRFVCIQRILRTITVRDTKIRILIKNPLNMPFSSFRSDENTEKTTSSSQFSNFLFLHKYYNITGNIIRISNIICFEIGYRYRTKLP